MDGREFTLSQRVQRLEGIMGLDAPSTENLEAAGQKRIPFPDVEEIYSANQKSPTSPTAFEEVINRIQNCTDRVCRTAGKLEDIGNRIMGQLPEEAMRGATACDVNPDGTLDHTFLALNWLDSSLARLEGAALRLERV